jgi:hypothetical protein
MYRKEEGRYIEQKSIDLQFLQDYEKSGCKLKELLEDCKEQQVRIAFANKTVEPEWMMDIYQMIMQRTREELKVEQRAGIRRALKRREEGTGTYGRPRIELPADFEQELKRRIANDESLSKYCNELKMKKSTFYKWVKVYRNSWER